MVIQNFPAVMADLEMDFKHPNRALVEGLFQEYVKVGDSKRGFVTYLPPEHEYCSPCLLTAIPSGAEPGAFMDASGLAGFAAAHHVSVHLMYPENGSWTAADADYINAVYKGVQARDYYITMQDNLYLLGIGDAAYPAQLAAKKMASDWSGLITIGDLTGDITAGSAASHGAEDQGVLELKVEGGQAQLPVWMTVSADTPANRNAVDYWKAQNKVTGEVLSGGGADYIWAPTPVRIHSEINEEYISQVRLAVTDAPFAVEQLEKAWAYAGQARRHRGQGRKRLRYYKDPIACGAVRRNLDVDGMTRTWYEYVPAGCTPDKTWPVVVCMHGRGGSAETFFDLSSMHVVAEARNFIALFPEAGVYQQKKPNGLRNVLLWGAYYKDEPVNDIKFIREMIADAESRLPVDKSRIYACGQSSGGMMTDALALTCSDIFAAFAPWSGMFNAAEMNCLYPESAPKAPVCLLYGDSCFV